MVTYLLQVSILHKHVEIVIVAISSPQVFTINLDATKIIYLGVLSTGQVQLDQLVRSVRRK